MTRSKKLWRLFSRFVFCSCFGALTLPFGPPQSVLAEDDKTGTVSIALHVVDDNGAAVPNALVRVLDFDNDKGHWQTLHRDQRCDQNGAVRYEAMPGDKSYQFYVRADDGRIAYRELILGDNATKSELTVKVENAIATTIRVHDQSGQPIAGAEVWSIKPTGENGSVSLDPKSLESCGISPQASNSKGELVLPLLPPGKMDLRIIHSDYVPVEFDAIQVGKSADATLTPGAPLELHVRMAPNEKLVDSLKIDLRCDEFKKPSTLIGPLPWLQRDGTAKLTVAPGKYSWLRLIHPDFIGAPIYMDIVGNTIADEFTPFTLSTATNSFDFELKRKVTVRGRVFAPGLAPQLSGSRIHGEIYSGNVQGAFSRFAEEWTHADWADINDKGEYELKLAAGRAKISFIGDGCRATPNSVEVNVATNGSTVIPDFAVSPMPTIHGIVQDAAGRPVAKAVVRFRGSMLVNQNPVLTDENGKFELTPPRVPQDFQTHEPLETQTIVAFDPFRAFDGVAQFRWDKPESMENIVLKLQPHPADSTIGRCTEDLTPWERGVMPSDQKQHLAAISLVGKPAPELDGVEWLNTDGKRRSLADFRGKYVLLQFWTTWCGPCHADMPSVRLVDRLYRDKGLAVIGVHDNSMPIEDIKKDAAKNELTYPIVVDQPDGRIIASYKAHGISGYPSYVLIGPDRNVIRDDSTIPGPTLRSFKIEIVREILMSHTKPTNRGTTR
ncbi:MAG TPA: redoxin domain-containing protein [Lacipirellulaceae bacterium]|nr:redoxin domain-containing protein [Lacipirellulaceae bacterium]